MQDVIIQDLMKYKYRAIRATFDKDFKERYNWVYGYIVIRHTHDLYGNLQYCPTIVTQKDYPGAPYGKLEDIFVIPQTISKCSGGKDIDGTFVYPGDIVKFVYGENESFLSSDAYVFKDIIATDENGAITAFRSIPTWMHYDTQSAGSEITHKIKIVGNIFENKELARDHFIDIYGKEDEEYEKGYLHDFKVTVTYKDEKGKKHTISTILNPSNKEES